MSESAITIPAKTLTQASEVTEILLQDIITGALAEGSRVSEPELSRRYGIGRRPLREAILRLEGIWIRRVTTIFHYRIIKVTGNQRLIQAENTIDKEYS